MQNIFDEFSEKQMRPVNEIAQDGVRRDLDEAVLIDILGLPKSLNAKDGPLELLRMKLGSEPSIAGQKEIV